GSAGDLYGIFINKVRRERPPEYLEKIKGLDKSRKRMNMASLDMLQFHWWDYGNDGYLDALKHLTDLKEEGKIKTLGLANFDTERLEKILDNGIPVVSNHRSIDTNLTTPLKTPSFQLYKTISVVDAWGGLNIFQVLLRTMKNIATKHGVSIPTVAVRYVIDQTRVSAEYIQDANAIFSLKLDDEDVNSIQEVTKKGKNLLQVIGDCGDEHRGK
ncbi:hypothetical protein EUTSA_v10017835mg, partial [Eutrema salsugineum]